MIFCCAPKILICQNLQETETLDKVDLFIVEALSKNARTSFRQIAQNLNVSPDTIIDRYNALQEKGIIRGSTIVLNPKEIGYNAMAVLIDVSPKEDSKEPFDSTIILETLIKMKDIIGASKTVGTTILWRLG